MKVKRLNRAFFARHPKFDQFIDIAFRLNSIKYALSTNKSHEDSLDQSFNAISRALELLSDGIENDRPNARLMNWIETFEKDGTDFSKVRSRLQHLENSKTIDSTNLAFLNELSNKVNFALMDSINVNIVTGEH